jgi:hypothetical protein
VDDPTLTLLETLILPSVTVRAATVMTPNDIAKVDYFQNKGTVAQV